MIPGWGTTFIIDCEKQDIYKYGSLDNWNNQFTLVDGEFFELKPGRNQGIMSGIQYGEVYITPNWWTVQEMQFERPGRFIDGDSLDRYNKMVCVCAFRTAVACGERPVGSRTEQGPGPAELCEKEEG